MAADDHTVSHVLERESTTNTTDDGRRIQIFGLGEDGSNIFTTSAGSKQDMRSILFAQSNGVIIGNLGLEDPETTCLTQAFTSAVDARCTQQPCAHGGGGSNENATGCVECTRDILEKEFKCSAVHNGNGQKLRQQTNVTGGVYVEPDVRVKKIIQHVSDVMETKFGLTLEKGHCCLMLSLQGLQKQMEHSDNNKDDAKKLRNSFFLIINLDLNGEPQKFPYTCIKTGASCVADLSKFGDFVFVNPLVAHCGAAKPGGKTYGLLRYVQSTCLLAYLPTCLLCVS